MDPESADWIRVLATTGSEREAAVVRLHGRLLAIARHEVGRRQVSSRIAGPELADLATQAADDALLSVLAKVPSFRGDSRFTTWAYRFVVLEVSHKLGRHHWLNPPDVGRPEQWEQLPDHFGVDPAHHAEALALRTAVQQAVEGPALTDHQRSVFVALVVDGVPLDALAERLSTTRGAVYKALYDARRNLRGALVEGGYLVPEPRAEAAPRGHDELARFLTVNPADVGCDEAIRHLHAYVDLVGTDRSAAERTYPGIVAHLAECGPCGEDYAGLLAAVSETDTAASQSLEPGVSGRRFPRLRRHRGR